MELAFVTALGVGGATIIGVLIGFLFQKIPHEFNDVILGFAAGIMFAAAVIGLIIPSLEEGNIWVTLAGILAGAVFLNLADYLTPHLHHLTGMDQEAHMGKQSHINKVMLFVLAIAIHNLPEGIAAGVGFGNENIGKRHYGGRRNRSPEYSGRYGDRITFDPGRCSKTQSFLHCQFYRHH